MNAIRQHARRRVMTAGMFATWLVVGLLTGWLAGVAMPQGGHGPLRDILLALVGSSAAGATLTALDLAPDAGPSTMALVALLGAALVLAGQRKTGQAPPSPARATCRRRTP